MTNLLRVIGLLTLVAAVSALAGCSSEKRTVPKGKLVRGGQPLQITSKGPTPPGVIPLRIEFVSMDGQKNYPAVIDADGASFSVPGPDRKGIPPGKYKVAVYFGDGGLGTDVLKGAFSEQKTPIVVTVEALRAPIGFFSSQ